MATPTPTDAQILTRRIRQSATAVQAPAIPQEGYINVQPQEQEESYNLLAEEQEYLLWEQGFQLGLPEFGGGQSAEEFFDWTFNVQETLEFKRIPLDRCVPMIVTRFRGRAASWWLQLKLTRARLSKPRILSWDKLKKEMHKTFLQFNYHQEMFQRLHMLQQGKDSVEEYSTQFFSLLKRINLQYSDQETVTRFVGGLRKNIRDNLLNPLTVAEAHQQALTLEAHITKDDYREKVGVCCIIVTFLWGCVCLLFDSAERKRKRR